MTLRWELTMLFRGHFVEYLASLITRNKLEPLELFTSDELETLIKTAGFRLPARSLPPSSSLVTYHHRLLEVY